MNAGEVVLSCGGLGAGMMKTSKVNKVGHSGWSAGHHDPWIQPAAVPTTTTTTLGPKEPPTNTSMDSGVAGLRDTPVHTPAPIHNNNNNNNMVGNKGNNNNNNEECDVPKFIVDHTTRTTYMKGRFLGKVSSVPHAQPTFTAQASSGSWPWLSPHLPYLYIYPRVRVAWLRRVATLSCRLFNEVQRERFGSLAPCLDGQGEKLELDWNLLG